MTHGNKARAALLAAAALFAGASWAQMSDGQRGAPHEGMGPMRGFERLHRQLNLNPQQEDLWKKAQAAQHEAFRTIREKSAETRARLRVEIDKPGVDLKQFAQLRDELGEQMRAQGEAARKEARNAWFSVYDSLDANQRELVRVAIRDGMDRMGHHGPRRGPPRS